MIVPLIVTEAVAVTETVTLFVTETDTDRFIVWLGASQTTAPVTAAWVVVAIALVEKLATAVIFIVCDGASQTTAPVTAACVVVAIALVEKAADNDPETATVLPIDTVPLTGTEPLTWTAPVTGTDPEIATWPAT